MNKIEESSISPNISDLDKNITDLYVEKVKIKNELENQIRLLNTYILMIIKKIGIYSKFNGIAYSKKTEIECKDEVTTYLGIQFRHGTVLRLVTLSKCNHNREYTTKSLMDESPKIIELSLSKIPQFIQCYKEEVDKKFAQLKLENEKLILENEESRINVSKIKKMVENIIEELEKKQITIENKLLYDEL